MFRFRNTGWNYAFTDFDNGLTIATKDYVLKHAVEMLERGEESCDIELNESLLGGFRGYSDGEPFVKMSEYQKFEGRLNVGKLTSFFGIPGRIVKAELDIENLGKRKLEMIIDEPDKIQDN